MTPLPEAAHQRPGKQQLKGDDEELQSKSPRKQALRPVLLLVMVLCCAAFFGATNPRSMPSIMLVVGFMVLVILLYCLLRFGLVVSGLQLRLPVGYRKAVLWGGTVFPVLLLMLQSIGQLTMRDILTLAGLFIIGSFYVSHARRSASSDVNRR